MRDLIKTVVDITDIDTSTKLFEYQVVSVIGDREFNPRKSTDFANNKTYIPTKGDKIYIYPGAGIPRFKVKEFCKTFEVSLVKYPEKANIKIVNPTISNGMFDTTGGVGVDKELFLEYLSKVTRTGDKRYIDLKKDIRESTCPYVMISTYDLRSLSDPDQLIFKEAILPYDIITNDNYTFNHPKLIEEYYTIVKEEHLAKFLQLSEDKSTYDQDDILRLLNTTSVMDKDMYEDIKRLFESEDNDNTTIAMEAMANCDFEKSAIWLLLLLQEYGGSKMWHTPSRNHVNFKSMLKFFGIASIGYLTLDSIIDSLIAKRLLTPENLEVITPLACGSLTEQGRFKHFKVSEVSFSEEIMNSLKNNKLEPVKEEKTEEPVPESFISLNEENEKL